MNCDFRDQKHFKYYKHVLWRCGLHGKCHACPYTKPCFKLASLVGIWENING